MNGEKQAMFFCKCHTDQLIASKWDDQDDLYLAMWNSGTDRPWRMGHLFGVKWRLRNAWQSLKRGHPWVDEVILSREDAQRLGAWLLSTAMDGKPVSLSASTTGTTVDVKQWTSTNDSTADGGTE